MTERLSDERLRELIDFVDNDVSAQYASDWAGNNFLCQDDKDRWDMVSEVSKALNELRAVRAKLAAGPVMPETPSDDVLYASLHPEVSQARRAYRLIRNALAAEQSND